MVGARSAFTTSKNLWHPRDIYSLITDWIFLETKRSIPAYGSEARSLRTNVYRLPVFKYQYLRRISGTPWVSCITNPKVKRRVLGHRDQSFQESLDMNKLRYLGHVSPYPSMDSLGIHCSLRWVMVERWIAHDMQKVWNLTPIVIPECPVKLSAWNPRDLLTQTLDILGDMNKCRNQWDSCIGNIRVSLWSSS